LSRAWWREVRDGEGVGWREERDGEGAVFQVCFHRQNRYTKSLYVMDLEKWIFKQITIINNRNPK